MKHLFPKKRSHETVAILNRAQEYDKKSTTKRKMFLHTFKRTLSGLLKPSTDLEPHVALQQNNKRGWRAESEQQQQRRWFWHGPVNVPGMMFGVRGLCYTPAACCFLVPLHTASAEECAVRARGREKEKNCRWKRQAKKSQLTALFVCVSACHSGLDAGC